MLVLTACKKTENKQPEPTKGFDPSQVKTMGDILIYENEGDYQCPTTLICKYYRITPAKREDSIDVFSTSVAVTPSRCTEESFVNPDKSFSFFTKRSGRPN